MILVLVLLSIVIPLVSAIFPGETHVVDEGDKDLETIGRAKGHTLPYISTSLHVVEQKLLFSWNIQTHKFDGNHEEYQRATIKIHYQGQF